MNAQVSSDARNVFIYFAQTVVSAVLPIVALLILTQFLRAEDFGAWALSQVYSVFAVSLCTFGMTEVFERSYFEYRDDRAKLAALLYGIIGFALSNFIVVAVMSQMFGDLIARALGFTQPSGLILLTFSAQFFSIAGMFYLLYYRNAGQATVYARYMVLASGLYFLGSIVLVIYADMGIVGIPLAQTLSGIVVFCLLARKTRATLYPTLDKGVFASAFRLAYPLVPRIFLGAVATQLDKFLLGQLASVGGVGIYSIAQRIANTVFVFMTVLQNVFSPAVYAYMFDRKDGDDGVIGRYLTPFAYISILAALSLLLVGEELLTFILPAEYRGAVGVLTVLCLYYGFLFFGKITGRQLMYAQRPELVSLLALGGIVVSVVVSLPLVLSWGTTGAAWGTFLAGTTTGIATLLVAQRYYRIRWQWPAMTAIFGIFLVSGIAMFVMIESGVPYGWRLAAKIAALGIYLYVGTRLNIITVANIRILRNALARVTPASPVK